MARKPNTGINIPARAARKLPHAALPKLHSSRAHTEDILDVASGVKPAALVNVYAGALAREMGLKVIDVPKGMFEVLRTQLSCIVCKRDDACHKVLSVLKKYPKPPRPPIFHVEMGRALGYSEKDIDHFLKKFYGIRLRDII